MGMFPAYTDENVIAELRDLVKDGDVYDDDDTLSAKSTSDKQSDPETNGKALAYIEAKTVEDVQGALAIARKYHLPVIPQSGLTGLVAGSEAYDHSLLLSTDKMNRILEINADDGLAVVEPGVVNSDLDGAARKEGLFYAPDPGSKTISRIGGNVSTNAGGMSGVKYGATRDNVLGVQVVLADGRVLNLGGRTYKQAYGYDLTHLFVGSEGTLGIITQVTVKLMPIPVGDSITGLAFFDKMTDLANAVHDIRMSGIYPTRLEAEDKKTVIATDKLLGTDYSGENGGAMLMFEIDVLTDQTEEILNKVLDDNNAYNVRLATDENEQKEFSNYRDQMYPAISEANDDDGMITEDMAVPLSKLAEMVDFIGELDDEIEAEIFVAGHAGDGNVHPILTYPNASEGIPDHVTDAITRMFRKALELGGTISGEHAVGLLKNDFNHEELGEDVDMLQHQIKALLDPMNLLNPKRKID